MSKVQNMILSAKFEFRTLKEMKDVRTSEHVAVRDIDLMRYFFMHDNVKTHKLNEVFACDDQRNDRILAEQIDDEVCVQLDEHRQFFIAEKFLRFCSYKFAREQFEEMSDTTQIYDLLQQIARERHARNEKLFAEYCDEHAAISKAIQQAMLQAKEKESDDEDEDEDEECV